MNESEIYYEATKLAQALKQTVGEKNDYYITLAQLMHILQKLVRWNV